MSPNDPVRIPIACIMCKGKTPGILIFGYLTPDRSVPSLRCETCGTRYTVEVSIVT
jgi:hypothetical protein